MSIKFAEQIIEGMVDENGNCGERGMTEKQWDCIKQYMSDDNKFERCGGWVGDHGHIDFWERDAEGVIGKYEVKIHLYKHFNLRVTVKSIRRWIDELPTFEHSEWQGKIKQRLSLELTLIRRYEYQRKSFAYTHSGYEWAYIYTLADAEGNCYVWKTTNLLDYEYEDEDGDHWDIADPGDKVTMKATVKEHGEYKGIKQTVITRPKVTGIEKREQ